MVEKEGYGTVDIKAWRKKAKISQEELAKTLRVAQATVSQWERGATAPSSDILPAMANAFGCTVKDLFLEVVPPNTKGGAKAETLDSCMWRLLGKCVDALESQLEYKKDMEDLGGVLSGMDRAVAIRNALLSQK